VHATGQDATLDITKSLLRDTTRRIDSESSCFLALSGIASTANCSYSVPLGVVGQSRVGRRLRSIILRRHLLYRLRVDRISAITTVTVTLNIASVGTLCTVRMRTASRSRNGYESLTVLAVLILTRLVASLQSWVRLHTTFMVKLLTLLHVAGVFRWRHMSHTSRHFRQLTNWLLLLQTLLDLLDGLKSSSRRIARLDLLLINLLDVLVILPRVRLMSNWVSFERKPSLSLIDEAVRGHVLTRDWLDCLSRVSLLLIVRLTVIIVK